MRKILSILILLLLLATPVLAKEEKVEVIVNGIAIEDAKGEIIEGRTFVPLRNISEKLGAKVDYYHEKDRQIVIEKDDIKILMNIGKLEAKINNKEVELEIEPYTKDDITMVPLRFISEALGEEVKWDLKSYCAIIGEISGKKPPKDHEKIEFKALNGSIYFPKGYIKDVEISTKALTEGDVTIISKNLKNSEGMGTLLVLNSSRMPIIESDHGFNLYYNSYTEDFVIVSYPLPSSFPKEIRKEVENLQKEYMEYIKTFQPTVLKTDMENLKWSKENKKTWHILDMMKTMFLPRDYFYYNIPYTKTLEENQRTLVYLFNSNELRETQSKVELVFDEKENLISYKLKFYHPTKELEKECTIEDGIKSINLFQELVLGYSKDKLPEVKLYNEKTLNIYEKGVHEQFKDGEDNIYVFDLTTGILELYSQKID
ncbi:MAG: copper amine oxidase N-terminal domain-containing protein [Tissierellia bacterium]|nr:copper amine oxidase N-terminal domain-containing protein [Tissierellia bacterium]